MTCDKKSVMSSHNIDYTERNNTTNNNGLFVREKRNKNDDMNKKSIFGENSCGNIIYVYYLNMCGKIYILEIFYNKYTSTCLIFFFCLLLLLLVVESNKPTMKTENRREIDEGER